MLWHIAGKSHEALSQGPGFLELSHSVTVSDGGLLFNLNYRAVLLRACSPTKWRGHLCRPPGCIPVGGLEHGVAALASGPAVANIPVWCASVCKQSWNACSGLMELSDICDQCHQTSALPPPVHFFVVRASFLDHHGQFAERCGISHVTLSAWWPLQTRLCCCGDKTIYILWLESPWQQIPAESSHWTQGGADGGSGLHVHLQCSPIYTELCLPALLLADPLAPVASGLCHHICLCCWLSDHWNPWGEGGLSAQFCKTLCCTRHPKIILTDFSWPLVWMRRHQGGVIDLRADRVHQKKQSSLHLEWLPEHSLSYCSRFS